MVSYMVDTVVGNMQVPRDIVVVWNVMVVTMLLNCVARHLGYKRLLQLSIGWKELEEELIFRTESWFLILISILDVRSWVFASTRIQKEGGAG